MGADGNGRMHRHTNTDLDVSEKLGHWLDATCSDSTGGRPLKKHMNCNICTSVCRVYQFGQEYILRFYLILIHNIHMKLLVPCQLAYQAF